MKWEDIYQLFRASKSSPNLLVNKRYVGAFVYRFVDIPNSYKQTIVDGEGNIVKIQYVPFSIPFYVKREKVIEKIFKTYENKLGSDNIIPVSDELIENYNQYWDIEFIGLTDKLGDRYSAQIEAPSGEKMFFSLLEGKELSDVWQVVFKPIPYLKIF